jgi:hypothetical protein
MKVMSFWCALKLLPRFNAGNTRKTVRMKVAILLISIPKMVSSN